VNWVDKLGLLCESHQRIGFLGSSYFIGVVIALMFVPAMSDRIGRREMFCFTLLVSIAAQIGLMWSTSLNISFGFMIVLGLTWPGKRVTGITYFLEFIPT
jgi:MFS family permease